MSGPNRRKASMVHAESGWRSEPPQAAPVRVTALAAAGAGTTGAQRQGTATAVGRTAFASPTAGWACVGGTNDFQIRYTDDGGVSWRTQLEWSGQQTGPVTAFDADRAALVLGLWPRAGAVNGHQVGVDGHSVVFAGTGDTGATWSLGTAPAGTGFTGMFHHLSPQRLWLPARPVDHDGRWRLVQTGDGGASWATTEAPGDLPIHQVAFSTPRNGVLIAIDSRRCDVLWTTDDGGSTWERVQLPAPRKVPAYAATWLNPVVRPGWPVLLVLRAERYNGQPAGWAGSFGYYGRGTSWAGPYRLPVTPSGVEVAVVGADGRFWAGAGQELWVADELSGPWRRRPVPLSGEQLQGAPWDPRLAPLPAAEVIAELAPVGEGVVWLTSTVGTALGGVPSGRLYRSEDDGAHWTEVPVGSA